MHGSATRRSDRLWARVLVSKPGRARGRGRRAATRRARIADQEVGGGDPGAEGGPDRVVDVSAEVLRVRDLDHDAVVRLAAQVDRQHRSGATTRASSHTSSRTWATVAVGEIG